MNIIQNIKVTVDIVVFTIISQELHVLLIKRWVAPYEWMWAIPWWFVEEDESCYQAAHRELREETWVRRLYLEQLYTFSEPKRDPRGRVVSIAYMALMSDAQDTKAGTDAAESQFHPFKRLPPLAFDHLDILKYAYQRLKRKLEYTNAAQYFLPKRFTLSHLQNIYEIIMWYKFDVRNFRKKLKTLNIVRETDEYESNVWHRPAKLYEFIHKELQIAEVL
jgi:8-oxo-dGTP diphosphatase